MPLERRTPEASPSRSVSDHISNCIGLLRRFVTAAVGGTLLVLAPTAAAAGPGGPFPSPETERWLTNAEQAIRRGDASGAGKALSGLPVDEGRWAFYTGRKLAVETAIAIAGGDKAGMKTSADALVAFAEHVPSGERMLAVDALTRACHVYYWANALEPATEAALGALKIEKEIEKAGVDHRDIVFAPRAANCLANAIARAGRTEVTAAALALSYAPYAHAARRAGKISDDDITGFFHERFLLSADLRWTGADTERVANAMTAQAMALALTESAGLLSAEEQVRIARAAPLEVFRILSEAQARFVRRPAPDRISSGLESLNQGHGPALLLSSLSDIADVSIPMLEKAAAATRDRHPAAATVVDSLRGLKLVLAGKAVEGLRVLDTASSELRRLAADSIEYDDAPLYYEVEKRRLIGREIVTRAADGVGRRSLVGLLERMAARSSCSGVDQKLAQLRAGPERTDAFVAAADAVLAPIGTCRAAVIAATSKSVFDNAALRLPLPAVDNARLSNLSDLTGSAESVVRRFGNEGFIDRATRTIAVIDGAHDISPVDAFLSKGFLMLRRAQIRTRMGSYSEAWRDFEAAARHYAEAYQQGSFGLAEPLEYDRIGFFDFELKHDRILATLERLKAIEGGTNPDEAARSWDRLVGDLVDLEAPGLRNVSSLQTCLDRVDTALASELRASRAAMVASTAELRRSVDVLKGGAGALPDVGRVAEHLRVSKSFAAVHMKACPRREDGVTVRRIAAALAPDEVFVIPFIVKQQYAGSIVVSADGAARYQITDKGTQTKSDIAGLIAATQVSANPTDAEFRNLPRPWPEAHRVFSNLFGGLAPVLEGKTIVWSSNRNLVDPSISRRVRSDFPMAMLVRVAPAEKAELDEIDFLGLANPLLRVSDTRSFLVSRERPVGGGHGLALFGAPDAAQKADLRLGKLKVAKDVLDALASKGATTVLSGEAATPEAFRKMMARRDIDVMAIATHLLAPGDRGAEDQPAVVASTADGSDGLIRSRAIIESGSSASLVMLIGCKGAASDGAPEGQALSGLPRALLEAGARNVLVSSNTLRDDVAPIIAEMMLTEISAGRPLALALRNALTAYRGKIDGGLLSQDLMHPAAWATLSLVGDGRGGKVR